MLRTEPIIGVQDVAKSSAWYQQLLGCKSMHGGNTFEMLANDENTTILCLHLWGDHDHPTMSGPATHAGSGLILSFRVTDLDTIWSNAQRLNARIESTPAINENSGCQQFSLRDVDGYYLIISL